LKLLYPLLAAAVMPAAADLLSDLTAAGVPADSVYMLDTMLVVEMSGSLSEGDSLLKHYGGVFYTYVDSMIAGWDVMGIAVRLEEATLVFPRSDMLRMLDWISESAGDEAIADWVLNHTRVVREQQEVQDP